MSRARALLDWLGPWPAFAAFAAIGCAAWAVALVSLMPLFRAVSTGATLITLAPRDSIGLPIGTVFFALAAITLSPDPNADRRRRSAAKRGSSRWLDWPALCLWIAAAGIALSLLAASITEAIVRTMLEKRGYVACPTVNDERPTRLRWTNGASEAALHCPHTWRDAA